MMPVTRKCLSIATHCLNGDDGTAGVLKHRKSIFFIRLQLLF